MRAEPLVHGDETGASLAGTCHWLHIACNNLLSFYFFHANRGIEALEEMGILPGYIGRVVHDFFQSYYQYGDCKHHLCNAHHLRDLTYIHEELGQEWAKDMIGLLLMAKKLREKHDAGVTRITKGDTNLIINLFRGVSWPWDTTSIQSRRNPHRSAVGKGGVAKSEARR